MNQQNNNSGNNTNNNEEICQPQIDLFSAFFRTRPSILTTVLPTSIHYAMQQQQKSSKNKSHQQENGSVIRKDPINTKSVSELNQDFKKHGIEYVPESKRFRFLASHVLENPKERAPVNIDTFKKASKVIKESAAAERKRRAQMSARNKKRAQKELMKAEKKKNKKAKKKTPSRTTKK